MFDYRVGQLSLPALETQKLNVSGPLIGQHSPAVLITYSCDPGRGSGYYFTQPNVGVFVNA